MSVRSTSFPASFQPDLHILPMENRSHFLTLFLKHQTDLKAYIRSVVPRADDAEDLLQEVALICWQKFDEFDETRPFGAWARGIATKKILQHRTKDQRQPTPFSPEAIDVVLQSFDRHSEEDISRRAVALENCVAALQDRGRRLLRLRYGESLSLIDLAGRLNMQPEAAQKALFRIRKQLKDCVRRRLDSEIAVHLDEGTD